ncbi:MAG: hypothetical protein ACI9MR_002017 [Myxococcota bacterium]|jgi:hypothetical protein
MGALVSSDLVSKLSELLSKVRLRLETTDDGYALGYEKEQHPVTELPLDGIDADAEAAELLAVAAAFEAAVKYPGDDGDGETLPTGAASLLPKVERARFARAYNAVVNARGDGDDARLFTKPFGAGLIVCYVQDEGWRFRYVVQGRVKGWDTSPDTVHSIARSNLYARHEVDYAAKEVAVGDGYDAARAVMTGDVFFDRIGKDGVPIAMPSRDLLFVGPNIDPAAVRQAYEMAAYPISPEVLAFRSHAVHTLDV